jgi:hypothetical protein
MKSCGGELSYMNWNELYSIWIAFLCFIRCDIPLLLGLVVGFVLLPSRNFFQVPKGLEP